MGKNDVTCVLYYKHETIVNDTSSSVNKPKASLNDAARGVIYDHHVFIIQATGGWQTALERHPNKKVNKAEELIFVSTNIVVD